MGRRRNRGESRSAGAGRPCPHPPQDRQYQLGDDHTRQRCHRCGADLLPLEERPDPRCTVLTCSSRATHWLARCPGGTPIPYCQAHAEQRPDWIVARVAPTP